MADSTEHINDKNESNLYAIFVPTSPERRVFRQLKEVRTFLNSPIGKTEGTRFKKCADAAELDAFFEEQKKEEGSPAIKPTSQPSTSAEPASPHKSIPTARFIEFRRAIEQRDNAKFDALLGENPRFLINTNNDTPAMLQEGYRFNAMHVACRASNVYVVRRCVELAKNLDWLIYVFGTDSCVEDRSEFFVNALINTPDLIENNTPIHYACKFGEPEIVRILLNFPNCKRYPRNKYNEKPMDIVCQRFKGSAEEKKRVVEEINVIFRRGLSPARLNGASLGRSSAIITNGVATPVHQTPPLGGESGDTSPLSRLTSAMRALRLADKSPKAADAAAVVEKVGANAAAVEKVGADAVAGEKGGADAAAVVEKVGADANDNNDNDDDYDVESEDEDAENVSFFSFPSCLIL